MRPVIVSLGLAGLTALAACASGELVGDGGPTDARQRDAAAIDAAERDGAAVDARADAAAIDGPAAVGAALMLTEIVLAPTGGELAEIYNPTASSVNLGTYYLADAPLYFKLPAGVAEVAAESSDFVAKFPAFDLPAGAVATIAIDTVAMFTTTYPGVTPTFSIGSGTIVKLTSGTATLTNTGEPLILFQWNGASDKVIDVDVMYAGTPSATNLLVAKTPVDGPDVDSTPTAYAADARTLPTQSAPAATKSTKRIARESAATETQTGGNGLGGHDETSEQTGVTWDNAAYTAPTPGMIPATL